MLRSNACTVVFNVRLKKESLGPGLHAGKKHEGGTGQLVTVEEIVKEHWAKYGRNFYTRYDYENVESAKADKVISTLKSKIGEITQARPFITVPASRLACPGLETL